MSPADELYIHPTNIKLLLNQEDSSCRTFLTSSSVSHSPTKLRTKVPTDYMLGKFQKTNH